MTKREQYGLAFKKIITPGFERYPTYTVVSINFNYGNLGYILNRYDRPSTCDWLNARIEAAQNAQFYDSDITIDGMYFPVDMVPPNLEYYNGVDNFQIPLQDFKELLQEWKEFMQQ